ncbi:hypothetical protein jhhlp_008463 [Lomentospora prolificans]|uniref:AB hydrolase-1 domain-containing protein n=1 Tax=Lomentospora prolificans TaxID=41688 RepID=A0A2N3MY48_9PEZI|nr:hypothetical protein jhhlp_008463 [Lomentospora prolificans]
MRGELYALQRQMHTMAEPEKKPYFPGFTAVSDQIYVRPGDELGEKDVNHGPRIIILYGWGDGIPKHVSKYTDGFRKLFPHAKQIVVLSPIFRAMRLDVDQRTKNMIPVIKEAFPEGAVDESENSILFHVMSNTGGINYSATLNAYKEMYGRPLPHRLAVYDSTPGSVVFTWENLKRWSYAMALGTAAWFPWPFGVTQGIWGAFLCANRFVDNMSGRESPPIFSVRILQQEEFKVKSASSLYLYSKEDDLILWKDIEEHMAKSREAGYPGEGVLFEGSGHVGHMRKHPEQYWEAIRVAWEKAIGGSKVSEE